MKFGIFYEHQLPRPGQENSEFELLQNSLTQIELADRLGERLQRHGLPGVLDGEFRNRIFQMAAPP
jgi:hypothetical protein